MCVLPLSDCFVSFPSFLPLCVYVSAFPFDIFLSFPLGKGGWEVTHGQGLRSVPHDAVVVCVSWGSGRRLLLGTKQKGRRVKYIRK